MFKRIEVRQVLVPVSGINSFILQELSTYSCQIKPDIVEHQDEARLESDRRPKDSILIPNGRQGAVA